MSESYTWRLLVVDDENAFCDALQEVLTEKDEAGYQVTTATTVKAACAAVEQAPVPFDLFLIDQRLGPAEPDGIELMQELLRSSPDSTAIVLTGFASHDDGLRALQAGANSYIPKNADWTNLFEELKIRVGALVENKKAQLRRLQELESLVKIESAVIGIQSEADLQNVLRAVVQQAKQALPQVDAITLFYTDRETGEPELGGVIGAWNPEIIESHPLTPDSAVRRALHLDHPHYISNSLEDPFVQGDFVRREKIHSTAVFPLQYGADRIGCMFFNYRQPHQFDENERRELTLFAQQAALAIHKAVLYDEAKRRQRRFETVARIMPIINATLEPEQVVRAILVEVLNAVPRARQACMLHYELETGDLVFSPVSFEFYHIDIPEQQGRRRVAAHEHSIAMLVARTQKALNVPDITDNPEYLSVVSDTRSELCVPIKVDEELLGVLVLESNQIKAFAEGDQFLLEALADQMAIALKKAQEHNQLVKAQDELAANYRQLLKAQDELAANSAIAWMGLFGSNWSHTVKQRTFEIESKVFRLRRSIEPLTAPVARWLDDIEHACDQLKQLRLASEGLPEPKPGAYTVQIDQWLSQHIPRWCEKRPDVKLDMELMCGDAYVPIDERWLEIPLEKLINNALKAMLEPGFLLVRSTRHKGSVQVEIQDTGKGIPEEIAKDYLFKRPVPKPTAAEGSGLGLLIARKVLTGHGGDLILVRTELGKGTTFMFQLPIVEPKSAGV